MQVRLGLRRVLIIIFTSVYIKVRPIAAALNLSPPVAKCRIGIHSRPKIGIIKYYLKYQRIKKVSILHFFKKVYSLGINYKIK